MIAKPVVLVAASNGHGRYSNEIGQTQQASRKKCKESITL